MSSTGASAVLKHLLLLLTITLVSFGATVAAYRLHEQTNEFPKSVSLLSPFPALEVEVFPDNVIASGPSFLLEGLVSNVAVLFVCTEGLLMIAKKIRRAK